MFSFARVRPCGTQYRDRVLRSGTSRVERGGRPERRYNLAEEEVTALSPRRARHGPHVCARSVGDAGPPGPYGEREGRETEIERERERKRESAYAGVPRQGKAEGKREMEKARDEERIREGGRGRASRSSRPRRQLPTDLSSGTCRSGAMSFCTFLLSAESSASPRGQKSPAGSPAGRGWALLLHPLVNRDRLARRRSVGAIAVFFRFEHSSMILAKFLELDREREKEREEERIMKLPLALRGRDAFRACGYFW